MEPSFHYRFRIGSTFSSGLKLIEDSGPVRQNECTYDERRRIAKHTYRTPSGLGPFLAGARTAARIGASLDVKR